MPHLRSAVGLNLTSGGSSCILVSFNRQFRRLNQPKGEAMKTAWTHDDLLVNLEAEVAEVKWELGIESLREIPDFMVLQPHEIHHAKIGDILQLANGKNCIIFDIVETPTALEITAVTESLRVIVKRY
jgi:hypothetical protein